MIELTSKTSRGLDSMHYQYLGSINNIQFYYKYRDIRLDSSQIVSEEFVCRLKDRVYLCRCQFSKWFTSSYQWVLKVLCYYD